MSQHNRPYDRKLAADVARQLDRRRIRGKLITWAFLIGIIALAVSYLTCGQGWGLGGLGKGAGSGDGRGSQLIFDAGPSRCTIRVAASGIMVDGIASTQEAVVRACKGTTGADVTVTGNARQGDWDELRKALEAANVTVYVKQGASK